MAEGTITKRGPSEWNYYLQTKTLQMRTLSPKHTNSLCNSMSKKQPNQIGAQDLNGHFSKEDREMAMKHMKRCSASVTIRKLRISSMWYRLTQVRESA